MTHPRLATLLALTSGYLHADRRAALEEHVANCDQCKAVYRTYAEMWLALEMEAFEDDPQSDLTLEMSAALWSYIKPRLRHEDRLAGADGDANGLGD